MPRTVAGGPRDGQAENDQKQQPAHGLGRGQLVQVKRVRVVPGVPRGVPAELPGGGLDEVLEIRRLHHVGRHGEGLAAALADAGVSFSLSGGDFGIAYPVWDQADPFAAAVVDSFFRDWYGGAPGSEAVIVPDTEMISAWTEMLAGFLAEREIDVDVEMDELGLPYVEWGLIGGDSVGLLLEEMREGWRNS